MRQPGALQRVRLGISLTAFLVMSHTCNPSLWEQEDLSGSKTSLGYRAVLSQCLLTHPTVLPCPGAERSRIGKDQVSNAAPWAPRWSQMEPLCSLRASVVPTEDGAGRV